MPKSNRFFKFFSCLSKRTPTPPPAVFRSSLLAAYAKNDSEAIEALIDIGVEHRYDIHSIARDAYLIRLNSAIKNRDLAKVEDLIHDAEVLRFDLNSYTEAKVTPLHYAVLKTREGLDVSLKIVQRLLDAGCDINKASCDSGVYSPLISAARKALPDMVTLLLSHGADRNFSDPTGKTALDFIQMKLANPGETIDTRRLEAVRDALLEPGHQSKPS